MGWASWKSATSTSPAPTRLTWRSSAPPWTRPGVEFYTLLIDDRRSDAPDPAEHGREGAMMAQWIEVASPPAARSVSGSHRGRRRSPARLAPGIGQRGGTLDRSGTAPRRRAVFWHSRRVGKLAPVAGPSPGPACRSHHNCWKCMHGARWPEVRLRQLAGRPQVYTDLPRRSRRWPNVPTPKRASPRQARWTGMTSPAAWTSARTRGFSRAAHPDLQRPRRRVGVISTRCARSPCPMSGTERDLRRRRRSRRSGGAARTAGKVCPFSPPTSSSFWVTSSTGARTRLTAWHRRFMAFDSLP